MIKRRIKKKQAILDLTRDDGTGDRESSNGAIFNKKMFEYCNTQIYLTESDHELYQYMDKNKDWYWAEWMLEPATCIQR